MGTNRTRARNSSSADGRGGGGTGGTGGGSTSTGSTYGLSKEFAADNPVRMPFYGSPSSLEAIASARRALMARSGRASTNLAGTRVYGSTFLGSAA